jgi:hypothetical protein
VFLERFSFGFHSALMTFAFPLTRFIKNQSLVFPYVFQKTSILGRRSSHKVKIWRKPSNRSFTDIPDHLKDQWYSHGCLYGMTVPCAIASTSASSEGVTSVKARYKKITEAAIHS